MNITTGQLKNIKECIDRNCTDCQREDCYGCNVLEARKQADMLYAEATNKPAAVEVIYAGGHGGLALTAHSDRSVEVRAGDGTLYVKTDTRRQLDADQFVNIVAVARGYLANNAEVFMLKTVFNVARNH